MQPTAQSFEATVHAAQSSAHGVQLTTQYFEATVDDVHASAYGVLATEQHFEATVHPLLMMCSRLYMVLKLL